MCLSMLIKTILKLVRNSTFTISKGKTLAIVGESGSGKSVTALSILKLLSQNSKQLSQEKLFLRIKIYCLFLKKN